MADNYPAAYTGHKPDGETKMHDLKCGVNTRMSLRQRIAPIQTAPRKVNTPEPIRSYFLQKRHHGETTYSGAVKHYVRDGNDVPERKKEPTAGDTVTLPKFTEKTNLQVANEAIAPGARHDFFSKARQLERADDDVRRDVYIPPTRAGASTMQRTVDIMRKREMDGTLQPAKDSFVAPGRRPLNGLPPPSAAETVKFTHISQLSCNQMDFTLPRTRANSALGRQGRRQVTDVASSKDMFAGTPKDREDLAPGFMGHVPAHPANVKKVRGDADLLRQSTKCALNVALPSKNLQRLISHASGPAQVKHTIQGFFEAQAAACKEEQNVNKSEHPKNHAVRREFFDVGEGDPDATMADQFFVRYPPGGGTMKQGPPSSWGWISEKELSRKQQI